MLLGRAARAECNAVHGLHQGAEYKMVQTTTRLVFTVVVNRPFHSRAGQ